MKRAPARPKAAKPRAGRAAAAAAGDEHTDGRRRRSDDSRRRIVAAMLDLIRAGLVLPNAAQVAQRARVGIRTVFRHFQDMEGLYREMADATEKEVLPALLKPYESGDWRERLHEQLLRRIQAYEAILPLKTAAAVLRHRSPFIQEDHRRHLMMERTTLEAILPAEIREDESLLRGLELAVSFQAWAHLRQDQRLPVDRARAVMVRVAGALTSARGE